MLKHIDTESLIKELLKRNTDKFNQKNWKNILLSIINEYTKNQVGPKEFDAIARTKSIKQICKELNEIQNTITFAESYKIVYIKQYKK